MLSNLDDIVTEEAVSPDVAMAHCMLWGGRHVLTFENETDEAPVEDGLVTNLVESEADDCQVQALNCGIAEHTVGSAPVAVAVRMGPNVIVARNFRVTVNGT